MRILCMVEGNFLLDEANMFCERGPFGNKEHTLDKALCVLQRSGSESTDTRDSSSPLSVFEMSCERIWVE